MSEKHMGSSIDDFLKEEGIFEEAAAHAVQEVAAWQHDEDMRIKKVPKRQLADFPGMPAPQLRLGAPGPSHLGTWDTTESRLGMFGPTPFALK